MGLTYLGIPQLLTLWIKDNFEIESLVETGTYKGDTSIWASEVFKDVYTVEANKQIFSESKGRLAKYKNIQCYCGNSAEILKDVVRAIDERKHKNIIYWLDAHWSLDETFGKKIECPLIEEIEQINKAKHNSYILIDDARLFLAPPSKPHNYKKWPSVSQVILALKKKNRDIYIYNDVIFAIPRGVKSEKFANHLQAHATKDMDLYIKSKSFTQTLLNSTKSIIKSLKWSIHSNKLVINLTRIIKSFRK